MRACGRTSTLTGPGRPLSHDDERKTPQRPGTAGARGSAGSAWWAPPPTAADGTHPPRTTGGATPRARPKITSTPDRRKRQAKPAELVYRSVQPITSSPRNSDLTRRQPIAVSQMVAIGCSLLMEQIRAPGPFCLTPIGPPRQCVCRTANASVQNLGASYCRANLAAIVCSILTARNQIKQSLSASVRRHRRVFGEGASGPHLARPTLMLPHLALT